MPSPKRNGSAQDLAPEASQGLPDLVDESEVADDEDASSVPGVVGADSILLDRFNLLMEQMTAMERRVDQKLANAILAANPTEPTAPVLAQTVDLNLSSSIPANGLIPPPLVSAPAIDPMDDPNRKVAFIPRENQLNPQHGEFDCWHGPNHYRIKRGDIGMLPLGFAVRLARSGHGYVVDLTAFRHIPVAQRPSEALADPNGPVVPPEILARAMAS